MKNRRNIIESELPPQNPLDIWMKDGKFYRSTKKGWTLIEDQMEFTDSKLMYKSTATSGTIGVNKETGKASIYNDVTKEWSPLGGGLTETTWQELKDKRDAGKLTPGALYRITDYNCTTTQENTQSAGHQFDIVLLALSANKLAEEGWAMMHDTPIYDVTFSDGVTKKCYIGNLRTIDEGYAIKDYVDIVYTDTLLGYPMIPTEALIINEETKTASFVEEYPFPSTEEFYDNVTYNYFQHSKLEAWKVWYCLDNDTDRFAWADDATKESVYVDGGWKIRNPQNDDIDNGLYCWGEDYLTKSPNPKVGDDTYDSIGGAQGVFIEAIRGFGRGVIYRLIDEFNNDVAYDFKNIQFVRKLTDGAYYPDTGTNTWVYTFTNTDSGTVDDASIIRYAFENKIESNPEGLSSSVFFLSATSNKVDASSTNLTFVDALSVTASYTADLDIYDSGAIYILNKKVLTES